MSSSEADSDVSMDSDEEVEPEAAIRIPLTTLPTVNILFMDVVNRALDVLHTFGNQIAYIFNEAEAMWQAIYGQGDDEASAATNANPEGNEDGYEAYDDIATTIDIDNNELPANFPWPDFHDASL